MPTVANAAAHELAARLAAEGLPVAAVALQRWRERGLLGHWDHIHPGGPGSSSVPDYGAYGRARLLARLPEDDRNLPTVTLLAVVTGTPVAPHELRAAVRAWYAPVRRQVDAADGDKPIDRAEIVVATMSKSRRSKDGIKKRAAVLASSTDVEHWSDDEKPRSPEERYGDSMTSFLAAVGGDSSWLPPVLADGLRLNGLENLVAAVGLDDPVASAELAQATADTADLMLNADAALDGIDAADVQAIRDCVAMLDSIGVFALMTGYSVADLTAGATPIGSSHMVGSFVAATVHSQVGLPHSLRDGLARELGGEGAAPT